MKRYRICVLIVVLFVFSSLCYAQGDEDAVVGTWKLVFIERLRDTGKVESPDNWMGKNPTGVIIYDLTGYMSVQFMRDSHQSDRHRWAIPEGIRAVDLGYYAYFGTYEVNEKEGFILHHVQGSLWPEEVGITHKRMFKISGNRMMLTTPELRRLTFERVEKLN